MEKIKLTLNKNRHSQKIISKILIFTFLISGSLMAQFSKNLEISSHYDDNLFRSPEPTSDLLTNLGLGLKYSANNSNFSFAYNGSRLLYQENALRNFSSHSLGFDYFKVFGKEDIHSFFMGADWSLRLNGDEYNYYDFNQLSAYANIRFDLDAFFIKGGYNYRYRGYENLPDLTNSQHFLFLQANKSFDTRTTIILEADLGQKSFSGQEIFSTTAGGGRGKGRNSTSTPTTSTSISEKPSLSQAIVMVRITQSLHDKVGIYAQYRRQFSLTDETNFVNADGYYQDEEIFDDPFSYESEGFSSQLTWVLPWSMKIKLGGAIITKNYISEQAFTTVEDSLGLGGIRLDDRNNYYLGFSKTFFINKSWVKSLLFNLNYSYIRNGSNSYWYDYKNSIIGGGINWNF